MESSSPPKRNSAKRTNTHKTYGDMFYDLLDKGHDPRTINYKEMVSDWIKLNILLKFDEFDCIEIEWLEKNIAFFFFRASKIWKQHRGKVTGINVQNKHAKFFDKLIDSNLSPCSCEKCLQLESLKVPFEMRQDQTNSSKLKKIY